MNNENLKSKAREYGAYIRANKEEVLIYIAIVLGLACLFFAPPVGEFILGLLTGFYFFFELVFFIQQGRQSLRAKGRVRYILLMGLLLGLLLFAPIFVITTLLVAAIRLLFSKSNS